LYSMLSINPLTWVFLITGFTVGFGHCIGMCGPIVIMYSLKIKSEKSNWPHLLYHAGRITTYSILGGVMGITGSFTLVTAYIAGIQKGILIFSGILIIIMGLTTSGWLTKLPGLNHKSFLQRFLVEKFNYLTRSKSTFTYFPMGLLLGLLPCGPVYTVLLTSTRLGMQASDIYSGFIDGMLLMTAFGLGNVPALFIVGKLAGLEWIKRRDLIYKSSGIIMSLVGVYFVYKGMQY
jgi:uncharacterized protein